MFLHKCVWNYHGSTNRISKSTFTLKKFTAKERKERPVFTGVLKYFPDALLEVAHVSYMGSEQHHPGKPIHWDRKKSKDDLDAMLRHAIDAGKIDSDGVRHSAKVAWRALAHLQKEIEKSNQK